MQVANIHTLNLNDSEIIGLQLTNENEIEIKIDLIVDYRTQESKMHKMIFRDCRSAHFDLHLAYAKPGSILKAEQKVGGEGFIDYEIETNTTASIIRISARKLSLEVL